VFITKSALKETDFYFDTIEINPFIHSASIIIIKACLKVIPFYCLQIAKLKTKVNKITSNRKRRISMKTRKALLYIIGMVLTIWLLAGCRNKPAVPDTVNFTGHWEDVSSNFSLDLIQTGGQLQGSHVVVAQQGNKIDSLDKSIEGNINDHVATIKFQSSFATNKGTAQISFIDQNTIFWKVTTAPDGENYLPTQATLVKKDAASKPTPAKPTASGTITGRVHLVAPPTPKMVVYAVDQATGAWAFTETEATNGEAPFSITVPPGTYQVFAAVASDSSIGVGYTKDYSTLVSITVAENQTVSGIEVGPPSQFECGATMGYPASPDGRFTGRPGPSADCLASLTPAANTSKPANATRIQFQPNAVMWQTPGDLMPGASIRFVLNAQKGQIFTVELTVPDSGAGPSATIKVWGADGNVLTPDLPSTKWKGTLLVSQDYYIEVRSLSQQNINYSLLVAIPAIGSTPYVAVTPDICQTLQRMANEALGVPFTMVPNAPFTDPITGETGQSCNLTATGTGANFPDPTQVTTTLANRFGFTEQPAYQANGPTGAAIGATRDSALALISAKWSPAPEAKCPSDQPISACNLTPEQKLYTIQIQAAMK
jgi:hypothetical protein